MFHFEVDQPLPNTYTCHEKIEQKVAFIFFLKCVVFSPWLVIS